MKLYKYHYYSAIIIIIGIGLTAVIMVVSLRKNINLYYPTKAVCSNQVRMDRTVYLEGVVKMGSVQKNTNDPHNRSMAFQIVDGDCTVSVTYKGTLPMLFKPGRLVVLRGKLISTHAFIANRVLAKHNNVYIPKKNTGS